jgi:hypothetical protein
MGNSIRNIQYLHYKHRGIQTKGKFMKLKGLLQKIPGPQSRDVGQVSFRPFRDVPFKRTVA